MSNDSAKELLAQADRLMRKGRTSLDDLPVLTDFVPADGAEPGAATRPPAVTRPPLNSALTNAEALPSLASAMPLPEVEEVSMAEFNRSAQSMAPAAPAAPAIPQSTLAAAARPSAAAPASSTVHPSVPAAGASMSLPPGAIVLTRAQFDQRIADKLEELRHAVFSQAMQQLELHAAGSLKERLRDALLPAL
ncbi:MAG: hypothetical protein ACK4XK_08560, partial [Casimicrobiaceae bacterium]